MKFSSSHITFRYYLYTCLSQLRFTRIIGILYIIQNFELNIVHFALLQTIFSLTQVIMEIPSGILGDYFKKKTVLILGLLLSSIAQLLIISPFVNESVNPFLILSIAFGIEGIARALISGADTALFYQNIRAANLSDIYEKILGKYQLIGAVSVGVATFIGGVLYSINGELPYLMQALFTIVAVFLIVFVPENKEDIDLVELKELKDKHFSKTGKMLYEFKSVVKNSNAMYMVFFISFTFAVINTIFGLMPDHLNNFGFSPEENGFVFMLLSLIGGAVATQSYRLNKFGFGYLVLITCSMTLGSLFFTLTFDNKFTIFIGLMLFYIIIDLLNPIAIKAFNSYVTDNIRASFLSVVSFIITGTTMVLYPAAGLIISRYGMESLFLIIGITLILLLIISQIIFKRVSYKQAVGE